MQTTRSQSNKQEHQIAKHLHGKCTPNSGGTCFGGGDVHTDEFFIEAKIKMLPTQSFSIKKDWLLKMKEQAFEQGFYRSALAFQFEPDVGEVYYIIPETEFKEYQKFVEEGAV